MPDVRASLREKAHASRDGRQLMGARARRDRSAYEQPITSPTRCTQSFAYIPTSFMYIVPMAMSGRFSEQELKIPQSVFLTIGALDALTGMMQLFATTYIKSGSLLILLQQSSIPLSMLISRVVLAASYTRAQYVGAAIVIVGILVILMPSFVGHDDATSGGCETLQCSPVVWSGVLVLSCVPMCLSTVYKERALAAVDCDPVYLNGWVALWQFLISVPLSFPAAPFSGVAMRDVPQNIADGWLCLIGIDSVTAAESALSGRPVDKCWPGGLAYTGAYLVFNQAFNLLILLMLKYGSANLLYLAMTLLVPLGNIAFALPFMPGSLPLTPINFAGLLVIMAGLFIYRFVDKILKSRRVRLGVDAPPPQPEPGDERSRTQARRAHAVMGSPSGIFAIESLQALLDAEHITAVSRQPTAGGEEDLAAYGAIGVPRQTTAADLLRLDLGLQGTNPLNDSLLRSDSSALFFRSEW
jgi:uncharacterized membrane protein